MEVSGSTAYILTNNHVAGGAEEMIITLSDGGRSRTARCSAPIRRATSRW
jgi:S1-C subfamily serine protease